MNRSQAITAPTVTELLQADHRNDDPLLVALRGELRASRAARILTPCATLRAALR